MTNLPIDYNAIRVALVEVVRFATGLDQNHVIMQEPETPLSARPSLPYIALKFGTIASSMGDDVFTAAGETDDGVFNYGGQRMFSVYIDGYGRSHEDAYNLMTLLMSRFEQEPTQDLLDSAGLVIWDYGSVVDLSALLSTGFEGRAHLDCQFGVCSNMLVDLGLIRSVNVEGHLDTLVGAPLQFTVTSTLEGD